MLENGCLSSYEWVVSACGQKSTNIIDTWSCGLQGRSSVLCVVLGPIEKGGAEFGNAGGGLGPFRGAAFGGGCLGKVACGLGLVSGRTSACESKGRRRAIIFNLRCRCPPVLQPVN